MHNLIRNDCIRQLSVARLLTNFLYRSAGVRGKGCWDTLCFFLSPTPGWQMAQEGLFLNVSTFFEPPRGKGRKKWVFTTADRLFLHALCCIRGFKRKVGLKGIISQVVALLPDENAKKSVMLNLNHAVWQKCYISIGSVDLCPQLIDLTFYAQSSRASTPVVWTSPPSQPKCATVELMPTNCRQPSAG